MLTKLNNLSLINKIYSKDAVLDECYIKIHFEVNLMV